jgi:membrane protein
MANGVSPFRELRAVGVRTLRRFVEIEGPQQATVLAAQAFTSLIPFLVVVAAFGPGEGDLTHRIVDRFGLDGSTEESVRALFNSAGETRSAMPWVGVGILVLASTSFSRAMQRMFERAYRVEPGTLREYWRALAWLAGFALWVVASGPLRTAFDDTGGRLVTVILSGLTGFGLWLATPVVLLRGVKWRALVPGAAVLAVLVPVTGAVSAIYVPVLMAWSSDKYGLIGIALSLQSWLVVMGFVVVTGAVVGAVVGERYAGGATARRR